MHWTPQQLVTFQTVARVGTMTAAAEKLGYTTGAVSQHVASLEREVGQVLFVRLPRRVRLTEAGETLLKHVEIITSRYAEAAAALEKLADKSDVTVQLGVFSSVAVAFLPRVFERLHREHPHVHVRLHEVGIDEVHEVLSRGRVDLTLSVRYPNIPMPPLRGVESDVLQHEKFSLVTGVDRQLSLTDLQQAAWILPPQETFFGRSVRQALHEVGITPRVHHVLENHVTAVAMAEAGQGITPVTPTTLALRNTPVMLQDFPGQPGRDIVLHTGDTSRVRPSVQLVSEALAAVIVQG